MKTAKTAKGRRINMSALARKHEQERAVSNVHINARGDIIDNRGIVKVTREEIKKEYYKDTVIGVEESVAIKEDKEAVTPKPIDEMTQDEILDELTSQSQEVSRKKRKRKDGTVYYEVEYEDGSMEEINEDS